MTAEKKAIIIGAGIGGITTSIFLARAGYKTEIYEKNSAAGGRCGQLIRDGHRFDMGATMLMMPGIYNDVFKSLNIDLFTDNKINPLQDLYKIYFDNNDSITFSKDESRVIADHERIEPGSFERSRKYVKEGYKIYRLGIDKLIARNFTHPFQMINFKNIGLLIRLKTYISNFSYAKRFFKTDHLRMAYTFQNIYVGQSPFDSPALFSMVPAAEITEGSFFPEGGMFRIVEILINEAQKSGVKIHFNAPVKQIKTSGNKAQGIVLEDDTVINGDLVIANADLPYVYRKLLPYRRKAEKLDRMNYSASAISIHMGLDKQYPQLGHHSVFLSDDFRQGLDMIFREKSVSKNPSFYLHAPANTDPSAAPPGHESLSFIIGAGHVDKDYNQDWEFLKKQSRDAVIERLKKFGLTDIEEHIKFEIIHSPLSWETACNISRGSVFGSLAHNLMQMGYFRPHNRHAKYKNLYFVGGSTHPGNGIPNVLLSAKLVSERILKNI
jgi:phytoene desaturase